MLDFCYANLSVILNYINDMYYILLKLSLYEISYINLINVNSTGFCIILPNSSQFQWSTEVYDFHEFGDIIQNLEEFTFTQWRIYFQLQPKQKFLLDCRDQYKHRNSEHSIFSSVSQIAEHTQLHQTFLRILLHQHFECN